MKNKQFFKKIFTAIIIACLLCQSLVTSADAANVKTLPKKDVLVSAYLDMNCDSIQEENEQSADVNGIKITLTKRVQQIKTFDDILEDVIVYNYVEVDKTVLDSSGTGFSQVIDDGDYYIHVDADSLPGGIGLEDTKFSIKEEETHFSVHIPFRQVKNVVFEGEKDLSEIKLFDAFCISAVAKDGKENTLSANIEYKTNDTEISVEKDGTLQYDVKKLKQKTVNITASVEGVFTKKKVVFKGPCINSFEKIKFYYNRGIINRKEAKKLYYTLANDPQSLPQEYQSNIPIQCGTELMDELLKLENNNTKVLAQNLNTTMAAVSDTTLSYRSTNFLIYYSITGVNQIVNKSDMNGNGIPDFVENLAGELENIRYLSNIYGFRTPPKYNSYVTVKIVDMGEDAYDGYVGEGLDTLFLSHSLTANDIKSIAAHEYFHLIQRNYLNGSFLDFWSEATAAWYQSVCYNSTNNDIYNYIRGIGDIFARPFRPINDMSDTAELREYGQVVFARYLSENYNGTYIIKQILENLDMGMKGKANAVGSFQAIESAVRELDSSQALPNIIRKYAYYNYCPAQYYLHGSVWQTALNCGRFPMYTSAEKIIKDQDGDYGTKSVMHLATKYYNFSSNQTISDKSLTVYLEGRNSTIFNKFRFTVQRVDAQGICSPYLINQGENSYMVEVKFGTFGKTYRHMCLIASNIDNSVTNEFYYQVALT